MDTWNNLWSDPIAGLKGLTTTMCFSDLKNEADHSFVVADLKKKLRVYKGTSISWESTLIDVPCAVTYYYPELNSTPNIAVAAGNSVYIYKNTRPFFKFTLPAVELSPDETHVWEDLHSGAVSLQDACTTLNNLRDNEVYLSSRSSELLSYDNDSEREAFIQSVISSPLSQTPCITCLGVLQKDMELETGTSLLVIGTENKFVYILDQVGSTILKKSQLSSVPAFISTSGLMSAESRVIVACRDSKVFTIKNGFLMSNAIELETPPSGLVVLDKYIYIGSFDCKVHCFHMKGRKLYSIYFQVPVLCMTLLKMTRTRVFKALLVGLENGDVKIYKDKVLLSTVNLGEAIQGFCFGSYGKDEGVLVCNLKNGGLVMKKIDKKANFEGRSDFAGPPSEQEVPLAIPAKSKLYLEQVEREKQNSVQMYKGFLKDLISIKLRTVKAFAKLENLESNSKTTGCSVRMAAYVQGLGPLFSIVLEVENTGKEMCFDIRVGYSYDPTLFKVLTPNAFFPSLVPGLKYKLVISVQSLTGASDNLRVFLITKSSALPVMSAIINVPTCEDVMV